MEFDWDERKAEQNIAKHCAPFEHAARGFLDLCRLDAEDSRHNYGEERRLTLCRIEGRLYAVAYTVRGETIRLISARKANPRERRLYDQTLPA